MSLYQLHRCVWDSVRAGGVSSGTGRAFDADRYDLTAEERAAFDDRDIAGMYRMGLHPVLLNGYCRMVGLSLNDYRQALQVYAESEQQRKPRWQR